VAASAFFAAVAEAPLALVPPAPFAGCDLAALVLMDELLGLSLGTFTSERDASAQSGESECST
jgi:hypothetical protein